LSIYFFFSFVSFLNAPDLTLAFRGFNQIFQGLFVVLSYGLIIFTVFNLIRRERDLSALVITLKILWTLTFIIALSQFFRFDIFNLSAIQRLILPSSLQSLIGNFRPSVGRVYITMYNSNFVGSYSALMLPISLALILNSKNSKAKLLSTLFFVMNIFIWLAPSARSGLFGIITAFIVFSPLWYFQIKHENRRYLLYGLFIFVSVIFITNNLSNGRVLREFSRLTVSGEGRVTDLSNPDIAYFEEINLNDFTLEIITNRESIIAILNPESGFIRFEDINGVPLATSISFGPNRIDFRFSNNIFERYFFRLDTANNTLRVTAYQRSFNFLISSEGFLFDGVGGVSSELDNAPRIRFLDGYERIASSRGYIWSRSIPMLTETIFIGYGPDMYVLNFPQRDLSGRLNGFTLNAINDKPHNMFLQIALNLGLISLFSLIFIYGYYFYDTAKLFWGRKSSTLEEYLGLGIATGIFAYLVAGIFNDQIISVAPLFYALTGVGLALNRIIHYLDRPTEKITQ
jgi:hypothetical protein